MNFWQKIFLPILLLFLLLFNGSIYWLSSVVYKQDMRAQEERAATEQYAICVAMARDLSLLDRNDTLNGASLVNLMRFYEKYYAKQAITLRLYENDALLYSDDALTPRIPSGSGNLSMLTEDGGKTLVCVCGPIPDFEDYRLLYIRDISGVEQTWTRLQLLFFLVSVGVSMLLAGLLLLVVNRVTRPIAKLAAAADAVGRGDYSVHVPAKGKDEVAQLTARFNQMTDEVQEHVEQLRDEAARKQRFLDNFTHELRTPLTNIYGYSELMTRVPVSEDDRLRYLHYIMRESKRLNRMSDELFSMTVLRADEPETADVDCAGLIEAAVQTLQAKAGAKGVALLPEASVCHVRGSWSLLESLIVNFTENAIRACGAGGTVRISFRAEDGAAVLRVADDGRGMSAEELAHIAEPFYRVDKARSRAEGGCGLGLALCSRIVRIHGAQLHFDSAPGRGTTVTVRFPREASAEKNSGDFTTP